GVGLFRVERISPGIGARIGSPRRLLPFRLGRKPLAGRAAIAVGVEPGDVGDRKLGSPARYSDGGVDLLIIAEGHLVSVDVKRRKDDLVLRPGVLLAPRGVGGKLVESHPERTGRDQDHAVGPLLVGRGREYPGRLKDAAEKEGGAEP